MDELRRLQRLAGELVELGNAIVAFGGIPWWRRGDDLESIRDSLTTQLAGLEARELARVNRGRKRA